MPILNIMHLCHIAPLVRSSTSHIGYKIIPGELFYYTPHPPTVIAVRVCLEVENFVPPTLRSTISPPPPTTFSLEVRAISNTFGFKQIQYVQCTCVQKSSQQMHYKKSTYSTLLIFFKTKAIRKFLSLQQKNLNKVTQEQSCRMLELEIQNRSHICRQF